MVSKIGNQGGKKSHKLRCLCLLFLVLSISRQFIMHHHLSAFSSERSGTSDRIEFKSFSFSWAWRVVVAHYIRRSGITHGSIRLFDHSLAFEPILFSWT